MTPSHIPPFSSTRLAVLIDAENTSPSHAPSLISRVAKFGRPTVRRAYGDWTTAQLTPWKKVLSPLAIRPQQQFRHLKGKNTSDSALIMDAMDLIHWGCVEGICIVSSDSDYVGLAVRIQEAGLLAYGFGLKVTHPSFVAACTDFVFFDELEPAQAPV